MCWHSENSKGFEGGVTGYGTERKKCIHPEWCYTLAQRQRLSATRRDVPLSQSQSVCLQPFIKRRMARDFHAVKWFALRMENVILTFKPRFRPRSSAHSIRRLSNLLYTFLTTTFGTFMHSDWLSALLCILFSTVKKKRLYAIYFLNIFLNILSLNCVHSYVMWQKCVLIDIFKMFFLTVENLCFLSEVRECISS